MAARKSALLIEVPPEANSGLAEGPAAPSEVTANTGFSLLQGRADRVDPYALAMDQVLGLETRPFSTISRWNSHAIEFAWSLAPVVCDLFSLAVKACVELELNWLSWIPGWQLGTAAQLDSGATALESEEHRRSRLAENMDIAIGAEPAQPGLAVLQYPAVVPANLSAEPESAEVEQTEAPEEAMAAAG